MRLKTRIVGGISTLLLGFCVTVVVTNWVTQNSAIRQRLRSKAESVGALTAEALANPLATSAIGDVRRAAARALALSGVSYVYVFDPAGRILSDGTAANERRFQVLDDPVSQRAVQATGALAQFSAVSLDMCTPVWLGHERIGGVRIGFELTEMHREMASTRDLTLLTGVLFLAAGVGLAVLLMRSITRPIEQLATLTRAVADGDFTRRVQLTSQDEIGELATSFNRMTASLRSVTVSRDYVDSVLLSIADGLFVLDPNGLVETVNGAACGLLDLEEDEIVGQPAGRLVAGGLDREVLQPLRAHGRVSGVELYLIDALDAQVPVAISGSALSSGQDEQHGFVLIARDIRERKRTQEALGALVSEVAVSAAQAEVRARDVRDALAGTSAVSAAGREEIERAVAAMARVSDQVGRTTRSLQRLDECTTGIGAAVHELSGLAKRTDLLALNAAIQAAQAGETAAGFATVANEIADLSKNAQTFTASISKVLADIESQVGEVSATNTEVLAALEEAGSVGETTRTTIAHLASALDTAGAATMEIAAFASQPAEGLARIREVLAEL